MLKLKKLLLKQLKDLLLLQLSSKKPKQQQLLLVLWLWLLLLMLKQQLSKLLLLLLERKRLKRKRLKRKWNRKPWPMRTPLRRLVHTFRQLRARSARSSRLLIRWPCSGRISFGLLCTRSRRVASSAISNCCRSGTFVRATLFRSVCTIRSCPQMPLTHHQCVFCMQSALQP